MKIFLDFWAPEGESKFSQISSLLTVNKVTAMNAFSVKREIQDKKFAVEADWWHRWCDYVNLEHTEQQDMLQKMKGETPLPSRNEGTSYNLTVTKH